MMSIDEFHKDLRNEVRVRSTIESDYKSILFMREVADRLAEAEEVENLEVLHFEGSGTRNRKLIVDGYDLDDADGSIALAVLYHSDSEKPDTLSSTDAKKYLAALENYLKESIDGSFGVGREESSPAYQLAEDIRRRGKNVTRYRLYLISDCQLTGRVKAFPSSDIDGIRIDYHIWDLDRMLQVFQSSAGREELDISLVEWVPAGLPALKVSDDSADVTTYLAAVPGRMLAELYGLYGSRLLESNVRSYLSARGKVNKGIKSTVLAEPEKFLAYNNGITATATGVGGVQDSSGFWKLSSIRDLQIVNGGQTTASLFYINRDSGPTIDMSSVYVQMKLVVVDPEDSKDLVPNISRYANSQNKVSETDFFSNSPFHVRLEDLSRRILAPAAAGVNFQTKWFYERTRGQYQNELGKLGRPEQKQFQAQFPRAQVITKTDAAKYSVSWGQKPHVVSAGAQKNFVAFADSVAKKWVEADAQFNEVYFKELVGQALLYNSVRKSVASATWYDKGYLANIVTYALSKFAFEIGRQRPGYFLDFEKIWARQGIDELVLAQCLGIAEGVFGVLTDPRRPYQNVTEWAKKEGCWESVRDMPVSLSADIDSFLTSGSKRASSRVNAKAVQKLDNGIQAQMDVLKLGSPFWVSVGEFGRENKLITPTDAGVIKAASGGRNSMPTERQSIRLLEILERVRVNGFRN